MNQFDLSLEGIRKEYETSSLDIDDVLPHPIDQFQIWLSQALKTQLIEPTAMHLSTVSAEGRVSGRIVLLKGVDNGLVFYSNYKSRKGQEIEAGKYVAATFFWDVLERQVRLEGKVEKLSAEESDAYFHSRPYKSQLGALVSPQSAIIPSREYLEESLKVAQETYPEGSVIPRPETWGGFRIIPDYAEFWQGRRSRLHDRMAYTLQESNTWKIERLAP